MLRDDLQIQWPTPYGWVYFDSFWRCLRPVPAKEMMRYTVYLHRTSIIEEKWYVEATSVREATDLVLQGDGDWQEDETIETLDTDVARVVKRGVDPDIDVDEGL